MAHPSVRAFAIAIGSNLGRRAEYVEFARQQIMSVLSDVRMSATYETVPQGVPDCQGPFLNAAAVGDSAATAREVLEQLLDIERAAGRTRPYPGAPRTLDLDLILAGDLVVCEPGLAIPHPRFRERRFVLQPLAEIAASWIDPVTGLTIAALLGRLQSADPASARSRSPVRR